MRHSKCQIILIESAFSILIYVMMLAVFLLISNYILDKIDKHLKSQTLFNKLTNIAEYSVNSGLAADGPVGTREPNLLIRKEGGFWTNYSKELEKRAGLSKLKIQVERPLDSDDYELCISDVMFQIDHENDDRSTGKFVPIIICGSN